MPPWYLGMNAGSLLSGSLFRRLSRRRVGASAACLFSTFEASTNAHSSVGMTSRGKRTQLLLLLLIVFNLVIPSAGWFFGLFGGSEAGDKQQDIDSTELTEWQAEELQALQENDVPLPAVSGGNFVNKHLTPLDIQAAESKLNAEGRKLYPSCGMVSTGRKARRSAIHCAPESNNRAVAATVLVGANGMWGARRMKI